MNIEMWIGIPTEMLQGAVDGFRNFYPWMTPNEALSAMAGLLCDCGVCFE